MYSHRALCLDGPGLVSFSPVRVLRVLVIFELGVTDLSFAF